MAGRALGLWASAPNGVKKGDGELVASVEGFDKPSGYPHFRIA